MTLALQILLVLTSFMMITLILLQKSSGGGMSDMFGGGISSSSGTSAYANRNLSRMTIITGIVWTATVLGLGILGASG